MKIKICDDEKEAAKELQQIIYGIMEGQEDTEIKVYGSGKELLHDIADGDVVFLDIEMPQMDGIEAGRCLKDKADCHIILETGQIQRFKEAFFIQALRFITKPFQKNEIKEALGAALARNVEDRTLEAYAQRQKYLLKEKDIRYARAINSQVELFTANRVFRKATTLQELYAELDGRFFFRINRQYIINFRHIEHVSVDRLSISGKSFKIARNRFREFKYAYLEFDMKYKRGQ